MVYDIAVDKKVREETYNGLVKIKDEIKENPKELFPILKEIVLEVATGTPLQTGKKSPKNKPIKANKAICFPKAL